MVCMVILYLCNTLERKCQLLFGVSDICIKQKITEFFFKTNYTGQSYINSCESRIKSATISE